MRVNFVDQLENLLKQSLTMSLYGTKAKTSLNQASYQMSLNIQAGNAVQSVARIGQACVNKVNLIANYPIGLATVRKKFKAT